MDDRHIPVDAGELFGVLPLFGSARARFGRGAGPVLMLALVCSGLRGSAEAKRLLARRPDGVVPARPPMVGPDAAIRLCVRYGGTDGIRLHFRLRPLPSGAVA